MVFQSTLGCRVFNNWTLLSAIFAGRRILSLSAPFILDFMLKTLEYGWFMFHMDSFCFVTLHFCHWKQVVKSWKKVDVCNEMFV